jgi:hypothetical protein
MNTIAITIVCCFGTGDLIASVVVVASVVLTVMASRQIFGL